MHRIKEDCFVQDTDKKKAVLGRWELGKRVENESREKPTDIGSDS